MPPIAEAPRSAKLPWLLCGILLPVTGWLAYVAYVAAPPKIESPASEEDLDQGLPSGGDAEKDQ